MNSLIGYKIDLSFDLPYHIVINKDQMAQYESSNEIVASSRIYFICRIKKIIFDCKSVRLRWGNLSFKLIIGNKATKRLKLPFKNFNNIKLLKPSLSEHRISVEINGNTLIHVSPREASNLLDPPVECKPEVLYVGHTFDKSNRYKQHEKLLKATTLIDSTEELRVYFQHMSHSFAGFAPVNTSPLTLLKGLKDVNSKTSIELMERLFIKLFEPVLNEAHVNSHIYSDNLVRSKLIENGIRFVHLDIGMDGTPYQYFSPKCNSGGDLFYFDLIKELFVEGIPDIISND